MLRVLSTHLMLNHRLHPGLLDLATRGGADAVEIFAARQHFDYTSREHILELAEWFQSNPQAAFSMHAPMFPDREMGRAGAPAVNVLHPEKARRIDAMDEIKRALEAAEHIPFRNLVVHLGERTDSWSPRALEYAQIALEHLGAFARPLGVRLLVENLASEPTTPERLKTILELGRLTNVGVCLDLGHAHMTRRNRRGHRHPGGTHRLTARARQPRDQGRTPVARRRQHRLEGHGSGAPCAYAGAGRGAGNQPGAGQRPECPAGADRAGICLLFLKPDRTHSQARIESSAPEV